CIIMKKIVKVGVIFGTAAFLSSAFGGTVITDNLPANTAIINISATQEGANGGQDLWDAPFYTGGATQFLEYTVQAGAYNFRIIDPADAAQLFPALTSEQTNEIYTAWTFNSPWVTDYLVFDSAATNNSSLPQLFDGAYTNTAGNGPFFSSATNAYNAAVSGGYYDLIRTGSLGRGGTAFTNSYTFTNVETLIFAVPDYALGDNVGGVSVLISPANFAPVLSIASDANTVTLQWPTNASGFTLSETTNLQNAIWNDVAAPPIIVNANYSVALPLDFTADKFFRLHNP
ncbi:MAG: hypothetical protein ACREFE_18370, partial [Limisphaerales bacterium]